MVSVGCIFPRGCSEERDRGKEKRIFVYVGMTKREVPLTHREIRMLLSYPLTNNTKTCYTDKIRMKGIL